jgi:hypothetical protein
MQSRELQEQTLLETSACHLQLQCMVCERAQIVGQSVAVFMHGSRQPFYSSHKAEIKEFALILPCEYGVLH